MASTSIRKLVHSCSVLISIKSFSNQLKAIHSWGLQAAQDLSVIKLPVLIANGDNDRMVPSSNTYD